MARGIEPTDLLGLVMCSPRGWVRTPETCLMGHMHMGSSNFYYQMKQEWIPDNTNFTAEFRSDLSHSTVIFLMPGKVPEQLMH